MPVFFFFSLFFISPLFPTGRLGSTKISPELIARMEAIVERPVHHLIRRGIFFSHRLPACLHSGFHRLLFFPRDIELILDGYEQKKPFFLHMGHESSSEPMHLGHLTSFMMTKWDERVLDTPRWIFALRWLQDVFGAPLVVQMIDEDNRSAFIYENVKDIIACGFDPTNTFIFSNSDFKVWVAHFDQAAHARRRICCTQAMPEFQAQHRPYPEQRDFRSIQRWAMALETVFKGIHSLFAFLTDVFGGTGKNYITTRSIRAAAVLSSSFPFIFERSVEKEVPVPCLVVCDIDEVRRFTLRTHRVLWFDRRIHSFERRAMLQNTWTVRSPLSSIRRSYLRCETPSGRWKHPKRTHQYSSPTHRNRSKRK